MPQTKPSCQQGLNLQELEDSLEYISADLVREGKNIHDALHQHLARVDALGPDDASKVHKRISTTISSVIIDLHELANQQAEAAAAAAHGKGGDKSDSDQSNGGGNSESGSDSGNDSGADEENQGNATNNINIDHPRPRSRVQLPPGRRNTTRGRKRNPKAKGKKQPLSDMRSGSLRCIYYKERYPEYKSDVRFLRSYVHVSCIPRLQH